MSKNMRYKTFATVLLATTFVSSSIVRANLIDSYVPTLDRLHQLSETTIDSAYNIRFDKVGENDANFVYYVTNADKTVSPLYYKISYNYDGGSTNAHVYTSRITGNQNGANFTGYFKDLLTTAQSSPGGAIYNNNANKIGHIVGDFIKNRSYVTSGGNAFGGAITNGGITTLVLYGDIESITGDFIGNSAETTVTRAQASGGAIMNMLGLIKVINANFVGNHVKGPFAIGGAIANTGNIGSINGLFVGNYGTGGDTRGGAIYNAAAQFENGVPAEDVPEIPIIRGDFIGNYLLGSNSAYGGAIANTTAGVAPDIYGMFIGNHVEVTAGNARAGAIDAPAGLHTITGSFFGNYAKSGSGFAAGGALYVGNDLRFVADGLDNYFAGNYTQDGRGKIYNAIYVESVLGVNLTFDITKGGNLFFNDSITAPSNIAYAYKININGYGSGKFFMNNDIVNASDVNVKDGMLVFRTAPYTDDASCGSNCRGRFIPLLMADNKTPDLSAPAITNLSLNNGQFYLYNNYIETVKLKDYKVAGESLLHVDVTKENGEWVADKLDINGNITGSTQVVVYDKTNADNRGASVLFIEAPNDVSVGDKPSVFRVYGSPYKWDIAYNFKGETVGSYWYLIGTDEENDKGLIGYVPDPIDVDDPIDLPTPPNVEVTPEVVGEIGLHAAAIEQTRSMVNNIKSKVAANKVLPDTCLLVKDDAFDGENRLHNVWANPIYHTATIDKPVRIEADIWGLEAGFDVQANQNHKLGVFASYRQGEYDLNGKGNRYYSNTGSKIDIDSYVGGLYYRYDYRHLWVFATLYGGVQQADIKTDDGVKTDTDGLQLGGSVETGYLFSLSDSLKLEPSLGVSYTQIDFDDTKDNFGKIAKYDTIRQTEIEAGVKLEKYFNMDKGVVKVYVKPSIIQVITSGDSMRVSGINEKINTYEDGTLGRVELGGRYVITNQLSTYGFVNYTFGSHYDATSLGVGLNYNW